MYKVGCAARILKVIKLAKDNFSVILQGVSRFEVRDFDGAEPFLAARVDAVPDPTTSDVELDALVMNLKDIAKRVVKLMPELPKEAGALVDSVTEPGHLADLITSNLELEVGEKQDVLETFDLKARMRKVLQFLSRQLEVLKVRERINTQVQEEMGRNQREYVLRQQLKAIKEELGELDDGGGDLEEFREKIAKAKMPEEAEKVARKQLERLKGMQPSSRRVHRHAHVPRVARRAAVGDRRPRTTSSSTRSAACLDEDHYDLEKVKKRIVEYMAVRKLKNDKKGPILCLAGPPGVGKTSLGRSVARAIGRKFVRISLGGVRDEAEIRGHRRTYVGSLPGRIIQGIKKAGHQQPGLRARRDRQARPRLPRRPGVGAARGARSRAEQHVLGSLPRGPVRPVEGDVHRDRQPARPDPVGAARPPGDHRAARLHAPGEEAHRAQLPRAQAARRSTASRTTTSRSPTRRSSRSSTRYTREAGVRNLEREIGSRVPRASRSRSPRATAQGPRRSSAPPRSRSILGPTKYVSEVAERTAEPGVATGLAWTAVGGDILFIEATRCRARAS